MLSVSWSLAHETVTLSLRLEKSRTCWWKGSLSGLRVWIWLKRACSDCFDIESTVSSLNGGGGTLVPYWMYSTHSTYCRSLSGLMKFRFWSLVSMYYSLHWRHQMVFGGPCDMWYLCASLGTSITITHLSKAGSHQEWVSSWIEDVGFRTLESRPPSSERDDTFRSLLRLLLDLPRYFIHIQYIHSHQDHEDGLEVPWIDEWRSQWASILPDEVIYLPLEFVKVYIYI